MIFFKYIYFLINFDIIRSIKKLNKNKLNNYIIKKMLLLLLYHRQYYH